MSAHQLPPPEQIRAVTCTGSTLVLHQQVGAMPLPVQVLVRRWLTTHGVDPHAIAIGTPVWRDVDRREVRWTEIGPGGRVARIQVRGTTGEPWPLPFPLDLISPAEFTDEDGYTFFPW